MKKKCICLITLNPNTIWLEFLNGFKKYDIYVVIDDNSKNYSETYGKTYPNISFIQINNYKCEESGFINVNFLMKKNVTGWEKALYYFATLERDYSNVWFIEDDVFFYSEKTILNIDKNHPDSDILVSDCIRRSNSRSWPHWKVIEINFEQPYFRAMVCATRLSKHLLAHIAQYARDNKTLFFLEALFPTIAKQYKLKYSTPLELITIVWRRNWKEEHINTNFIYHPIKNIEQHEILRKKKKPNIKSLTRSFLP